MQNLKSFDEMKQQFFKTHSKYTAWGQKFRNFMLRELLKADKNGKTKTDILYFNTRYLSEDDYNYLKDQVAINNGWKLYYFFTKWNLQLTYYNGGKVDRITNNEFEHYEKLKTNDVQAIEDKAIEAARALYEVSNCRITDYEQLSIHEIDNDEYQKHFQDNEYMFVKGVHPISYEFTLVDDLNEPLKDGDCLPTAIFKLYKQKIPSLTFDIVNKILWEGCELMCHNEGGKHCEHHRFIHATYFFMNYKISWYYFDIKNRLANENCKHVYQHGSNYKAFIAYGIDEHLYLVNDDDLRKSLVKANANTSNSLINTERREKEFDTKKLLFNVDVNKLQNCDADVIYYDEEDLKASLYHLYVTENKMHINKFHNKKVTEIKYRIKDEKGKVQKQIILRNNPNKVHNLKHDDMMKFCDNFGLEFNNQSITSVSQEIFSMFHDKKAPNKRINWSRNIKREVQKRQKDCCNICGLKCVIFDFDHIVRLIDGGDHSIDNCQALCKNCHENKTNKEINEDYFGGDMMKSNYNSITLPIFSRKKSAFIQGKCTMNYENLFGLDNNKNRRNILRYSEYDYCVFSSLDEPKPFDGEITTAFYYIESQNTFPLKKNDWYSLPIVQYCLENGIITHDNIKFKLTPSYVIPHNYFVKFIDWVLERSEGCNPDIIKRFFNCFIGSLGNKNEKNGSLCFTQNLQTAAYCAVKYQDKVFKTTGNINGEEKDIFHIMEIKETHKSDSYVPIYNQVLDIEAIELHKSVMLFKELNFDSRLVYLNTDQVVVSFKNAEDIEKAKAAIIPNYFWDSDKKVPKYKEESCIKHKNDVVPKFDDYIFTPPKKQWNIINDPQHNDFKTHAIKLIDELKSFLIDGRAGTGKSTLVNTIKSILDDRGIKYMALAPTNKAANVIHGQTLHKFFMKFKNMQYDRKKKKQIDKFNVLNKYEYIIVDEISMVKEVFYRYFYWINNNYPSIKFIIAGDFGQLPAVCDINDFDYENSTILKEICQYNKVLLSKCRRANDKLFNECMNVSQVKKSNYRNVKKKLVWTHIVYHNKLRKSLNQFCMTKWIERNKIRNFVTIPKYEGPAKEIKKQSQDIHVYKGLPLLGAITNSKLGVFNAEEYVVDSFTENICNIKQKFREETIEIDISDITKYFVPAYAMTVWKSQGTTITSEFCIHEWDHFDDKMKYVAISRSTCCENIFIE